MRDIRISKNHLRGIVSTLSILDEALGHYERWAKGGEAAGVLFQEHNRLDATQRHALLAEVQQAREVLVELRDDLHLEVRSRDVSTAIWSKCTWLWESLVELKSRYLKRYGALPDTFADYFDPKIEILIGHVDRCSVIARRTPRQIKGGDPPSHAKSDLGGPP